MKEGNPRPRELTPSTSEPGPKTAPQAFITILPDGEIAAWGLDREAEKLILNLTGNRELIKANRAMAYELCG